MDGVPMIGRLNGNFDLNQINLFNVDHIELIKGPMSVIYGSNALAGAINIITKENKTSKLNTVVDGYYESVGQYNLNFSASSCLGKQGIAIEGGRNLFDGYSYDESSDRQMDYKPRRQYFFDGYYFYSDNGKKLKANANYLNELMVYKGALLPPYYETAFDDYYTTHRAMFYLSGSFDLKRSYIANFLASYSYYNRTRQTKFKDLTIPSEIDITQDWGRDTTQMSTIGFRTTFARSNADFIFNYQVGLDLNHETGSGERILGDVQEIGDYAMFFSTTINPGKTLSLQPSVRFAYNTKYSAPVVWSLSGKWDFLSELSLRVSFASGFRAPGIKELYLSFVNINHDITGNPDLKAEYSKYGNVDLTWSSEQGKKAMSADLSIYFNYIDDKISLARVGNTMKYVYSNVSKYISTGFSFDYSFALHPSLTVQTGLSLTGISGTIDSKISAEDLVWTPDISISPTYRFVKHDITLALYYKFSGSTPQLVINANELGYNMVEQYNTLDFTATKGFFNNRVRLSAGVKNILNVTTITSTGAQGGAHSGSSDGNTDIGYGRTWFGKLTFQFNKYK
jgi:outer membrane receptor for ferrienterochelin and colicins